MGTGLGTGLCRRQKERARGEIIGKKAVYLIDAHGKTIFRQRKEKDINIIMLLLCQGLKFGRQRVTGRRRF